MTWPIATVACFALALLFSYRINTRHIDRRPRITEDHQPTQSRKLELPPDVRKRIEAHEEQRRPMWENSTTHRDIRRRWQIDHTDAGHTNRMQAWWGKGFD